jgi:hypothetical protein
MWLKAAGHAPEHDIPHLLGGMVMVKSGKSREVVFAAVICAGYTPWICARFFGCG